MLEVLSGMNFEPRKPTLPPTAALMDPDAAETALPHGFAPKRSGAGSVEDFRVDSHLSFWFYSFGRVPPNVVTFEK